MNTLGFLAVMVVVYAVLQIVSLCTLTGVQWRLAFGIAIPAAASSIVGVIGFALGVEVAPMFFLVFAPIGAGCLVLLLGAHILGNARRR